MMLTTHSTVIQHCMRMSEQTDLHVQQEQQNIYNHNTNNDTNKELLYTSKQSRGKTFAVFAQSRATKVFMSNFTTLGIHYYKKLLPRKFSRRIFIFALTAKVFPLDSFDVPSFLRTSTIGDAQRLVEGCITFFCNICSNSFVVSALCASAILLDRCRIGAAPSVSILCSIRLVRPKVSLVTCKDITIQHKQVVKLVFLKLTHVVIVIHCFP